MLVIIIDRVASWPRSIHTVTVLSVFYVLPVFYSKHKPYPYGFSVNNTPVWTHTHAHVHWMAFLISSLPVIQNSAINLHTGAVAGSQTKTIAGQQLNADSVRDQIESQRVERMTGNVFRCLSVSVQSMESVCVCGSQYRKVKLTLFKWGFVWLFEGEA